MNIGLWKSSFYYLLTVSSCLLLSAKTTQADTSDPTRLSSLIQLGIQNSLDQSAAKSESKSQEENEDFVKRTQNLPQINLTASYQRYYYDSLYETAGGAFVENNGRLPALGLTISYDLQKLLNADSAIAEKSSQLAKIEEKISKRNVIRNIKQGYYTIVEIQSEIRELNKIIGLFSHIDEILQKQKKIGIYNEIERKQFQVQQSILMDDLQAKSSAREATYAQLSLAMNVDVDVLKERIPQIKNTPALRFTKSKLSPEKLSTLNDREIIENLSRDFTLAQNKYDHFHSLVLPALYVRGSRELPTMPSSDGYQTVAEIGLSFPIDSFFTRSVQKSQFGAKAEKEQSHFKKALLNYRNQIRLDATNLNRYQNQSVRLESTQKETKALLDKAFLFYSQKRIDVLGTLDIFQKYFQAAINVFQNNLRIEILDAELEYLVGDGVSS